MREDVLGPYAARVRDKAKLNGPGDQCRLYSSEPVSENSTPIDTFDDLLKHSETIVRGRITGIREGFYYGVPGSLMRVEAVYVKGAPKTPDIYVFYTVAKIRTKNGLICARPLANYTNPAIGDQLLVFSRGTPAVLSEGASVLWVDSTPAVGARTAQQRRRTAARISRSARRGTDVR